MEGKRSPSAGVPVSRYRLAHWGWGCLQSGRHPRFWGIHTRVSGGTGSPAAVGNGRFGKA